nr:PAP2 superfamily protein [uncultured bacterium]
MDRRRTQKRLYSGGFVAAGVALIAFATVTFGGATQTADAGPPDDAVLDWNLHAIDALINASGAPTPGAGQTPPVSVLHLAMVQGAVYDAVNMIDRGHEPYNAGLPMAPTTASKAAAVATAAHHVLVGVVIVPPLSPAIVDRLDNLYADSLEAATTQDGASAVAQGVAAGAAAATAMLEERDDDGRYGTFTFAVGAGDGEWRPTPPGFANDPFAWVARVEPFVLKSTSQFRTKGPHALNTGIYKKEYEEVRDFGGNGTTTQTLRTSEQTALAQFYTANPVEMFNRTFRVIAEDQDLTLVEEARLFAMLNLAGADALINCWDDKAHWSFWRPVTAIQDGDDDDWTPLVVTPPYPDHPSGYNCVTSALMHSGAAYFDHKNMQFSVTRLGTPNVTRDYNRFTDVIQDTIDARVYLGIHFRAADVQGAGIGRDVARWLEKHYFKPAR